MRLNPIPTHSGRVTPAQAPPHKNSLGYFLLQSSSTELPFKSALAPSLETRNEFWDDKVKNVLDKEIIHFIRNADAADTQAPSFTRYGMPQKAYKAWSDCVQEPAVAALYSGIPVSRKQLNQYFAQGRNRLAKEAAEFTATVQNQDLDSIKNKLKTDYFGTERFQRLLTPLGDNGPYEPFSHRAINLIKNGVKVNVFKRTGHLTLNDKTLRLTVSNMNKSPTPDSLALVYSTTVGKLRLRTTSTYMSAMNGRLAGIELPSNMSLNWNRKLPKIFWQHAPHQNIPYLETQCNQCYESIVDEKHLPVELTDKLLLLHYLESHLCKFMRGSASINNWQTQSLLKAFGAGEIEMPQDLDCLALSHHQPEEFIREVREKYPQFVRVSTRIRQPETLAIQLCTSIKNKDHATTQMLLQGLGTAELMHVKSPSGLSLMQLAAKYDNPMMVKQLVNTGISTNHCHDERTPLMLAIRNGSIQSALQLVEYMKPHEIEPLTPNQNHPLHHLIIADYPEREMVLAVEMLCLKLARNNQNLNSPDSRGETPAQIASKLGKPLLKEIIESHARKFPLMELPGEA